MDDNNAKFFYEGAMNLLKPYIDSGKLVFLSNQTTPELTQTQSWSTKIAHKRLDNLIETYGYSPQGMRLDAIQSPADCISEGIV